MEEQFRAALLANSGLAAIVGTRIDWGLRGQAPSIRLQVVSGVPFYTHSGRNEMTPYLVQADCFGARFGDAKRVARAVQAACDNLGLPNFDSSLIGAFWVKLLPRLRDRSHGSLASLRGRRKAAA